ncbi:MAG: Vms1/Ankzf1 family peptidyl-tRNA hydrolase [Halodesulfurarchaeum sp.]
MLDRLLGRAPLKDRIAELEEERDSLESRLEAETERRREAARKRQEAAEQVNRLEDRIAELEDRVERAEAGEETVAYRGEATLRGDRLERVLSRLESVDAGPEGALSAMVETGAPDPVREVLGERAALVDRAAPTLVYVDDEQLVSVALRPPVRPDTFVEWDAGFAIEREWFQPRGRYALALVRSDLFALGEYQAREQLDVTGFQTDVQADHSKGGFSQARFERRRDEQIDDHLERCREAIEAATADRVYLVGESTLLPEFADLATVSRPVGATGKPREALEDAFEEFWRVPLRLL